ncbi:YqcI/YcgG family protein [Amycolatopsis sp. PS_44_ISF1]|uniref:YqcI/YcgG family protein n=1 Tax=Amycolatopsis sp. PS_44_ISF1 TaxID=2974917 RepID=UPI0028DF9E97|nr:YqcI/YcgG family protein [Amycolatopsis sp. PS_44_ISF1]MDT8913085.1 YqcI/YcgG family protein [Amycolatopsis sp. PS_44_ISF1]
MENPVSTGDDLASCVIGELPDWGRECLDELVSTLLSRQSPFPCTFAVAAAKKNTLRFGFIDDLDDEAAWKPLLRILSEYLAEYRDISRDTSLAVFFPPEPGTRTLAEYNAKFWSVLQYLHDNDPGRWPRDLPADAEDPLWEFAFGDTSIFVVCNTPAHATRHSRHSSGFLITFQPRWVFEGLEPETPRGTSARRVIRKRLRAYDGMEPSRHLGDYGNEENREWRQYFLPDDNTSEMPRCPFLNRRPAGPLAADGDERA